MKNALKKASVGGCFKKQSANQAPSCVQGAARDYGGALHTGDQEVPPPIEVTEHVMTKPQLIITVPGVDDIRVYIVIRYNQRPRANRLSIRAYIRTGIERRGIRIDPTGQ